MKMQWVEIAKEKITQGSIVDGVNWGMGEENPLSIVLSNACDIENDKCSFLILLPLMPATETLGHSKEFKSKIASANNRQELATKPWRSLSDFLASYIHNKNICRYYYINLGAQFDDLAVVVDFQMIKSIPIEERDNLENIAQLSNPFVEQMIIHFTSYTARIPSDRVDPIHEEELVLELAGGYKKGG